VKKAQSAETWDLSRPYSPATIRGGWIHVAGHVPVDRDGRTVGTSAREQTHAVLPNIGHTLKAAGASLRDVVSTSVFLTDIHDIDAVYREVISTEPYPARTTVQIAALGRPEFLVEVSAIAVLPQTA
jgi:2-iminobutanoate/2-iminopropanoate deaminase